MAAVSAAGAVEDDDRERMGTRLFRTLTWSNVGLGVPALIGGLVWLVSQLGGTVVVLVGILALLVLWTGSMMLGALATKVARHLSPWGAAAVVFAFCSFGAPLDSRTAYRYAARRHRATS